MELTLTDKQLLVLDMIQEGIANEILFGGAAGGGKSYLLRALAIIWAINVPGVQVYIFRRKVKDLVATHMRGPTSFSVLLDEFEKDKLCKINNSNNYIEFANKSIISLNHCQHDADLTNFLSSEIHILLMDESTTFTEKMIRFLRGRLRIGSLKIPEQFIGCLPFIVYASNPRGASHRYFKSKFVDAADAGEVFLAAQSEGGMNRAFVPSLLSDNPHIEEGYANRLRGLGDPDVVEAYLKGDWGVVEGAALKNLKRKFHMIRPQFCCSSWPVYRAYDYGFSAPYFVFFYMVATGESSTAFNPPKGSIILFSEIYGADEDDHGLQEDVSITAKKIKMHQDLYFPGKQVKAGPADNSIFDKEQGPSIADKIKESVNEITFEKSNKSPGSRVLGLGVVRAFIFNAIFFRHEKPGLYITTHCVNGYSQLCDLQLDEKNVEDVDTEGNDHSWDVLRYLALNKQNEITTVGVDGA